MRSSLSAEIRAPLSKSNSQPSEQAARRPDGLLTTGEMARRSNSTLRTVRFYEEAGLIRPAQRTEGGHRLFAERELYRLRLVGDLRAAGFSLEDIKELLEAKRSASSAAEAARGLIARLDVQVGSMKTRVVLLQRLLEDLQAARRLLVQCSQCDANDRFPDSCDDCEVVAGLGPMPTAVGVLWHLS